MVYSYHNIRTIRTRILIDTGTQSIGGKVDLWMESDELCPAAASMRAEELRHVRRGRRQAPPGRRERASGELRPSRHGCAWRAAAPRPPQVQAKASSARPPVRARELRPAATGAGAGELCPAARSRTPRSRSPGQVPPWHVHVGCGRWRGKFWASCDSLK